MLGLGGGEGVDLLVEHVEQVDAAFEDEPFRQLDVRVMVWVHAYYINHAFSCT